MQARVVGLMVMVCASLAACGGKAPESEATSKATAEPAAAPECSTVQDARGRSVAFRPTVDPKQLAATGKSACDLAKELVRHNDEQVRKGLADLCSRWDPESVARMRAILQNTTRQELEADAQMRGLANAMIMCTDRRDQTTLDMLFEPAIYSVGRLPARGEGCFAYLGEMHIEGHTGRGYVAQLLGDCAGQRLTSESEPDLSVLGQALVTAGYTGALPATYVTPKGETVRFAPESTAAAVPVQAPSVASGGIPARFVGVYEQDPAACRQAEEAGAPGDTSVIIRADAIESYELGCQLRTVSAASAEAFMGVFDCAVEGESEERTRSLRWSGEKLFIDGDGTPYAKCNVAAPAPFEPRILESDTTPPPAPQSVAQPAPVAASAPVSGDDAKVAGYARELSANWMSSGTCGQLKQLMLQFSQSSAPANVRVLQMEKMFDKAYDAGCILQ